MAVADENWKYKKFFPGVGRMNLLTSIKQDLEQDIQIVVMTGLEGVGKSVVGKELVSSGIEGGTVVMVQKAMESFDDLVFLCCEKLGVSLAGKTEQAVSELIDDIGAELWRKEERLILVLDSAETLYLATLERIRKMVERINSEGLFIQVLFIGRPGLLNNLERLEICDFQEVPEMRYVLEPLRRSETTAYIERYVRQLPEEEQELFTSEGIEQMYQKSLGNLHTIDKFIEDTRSNHNQDRSFWVLLDNVEEGIGAVSDNPFWTKCRQILAKFFSLPQNIKIGGGVVACLLVIWLFYPGSEPEPNNTEVTEKKSAVEEIVKDHSGTGKEPLAEKGEVTSLETTSDQKVDDSSIIVVKKVIKSEGVEELGVDYVSTPKTDKGDNDVDATVPPISIAETKENNQSPDSSEDKDSLTGRNRSKDDIVVKPAVMEADEVKTSRIERQETKKLVVEVIEPVEKAESQLAVNVDGGGLTVKDIPAIQAEKWKKIYNVTQAESAVVEGVLQPKTASIQKEPKETASPTVTNFNSDGNSKKIFKIRKAIVPDELK